MADALGSPRPDALGGILTEAGIDRNSAIRITGPGGLTVLLWFSRHGFNHVGCVRLAAHPAIDGDLLIVPRACDVATMDEILAHGPSPRLGGVLIVRTPEPPCGAAADPVDDVLVRHGYAIERRMHGRHQELHVARRRVSALASAA